MRLVAAVSRRASGPMIFYYWDDFWGVAGLKAAAFLCASAKDSDEAVISKGNRACCWRALIKSLKKVNVV